MGGYSRAAELSDRPSGEGHPPTSIKATSQGIELPSIDDTTGANHYPDNTKELVAGANLGLEMNLPGKHLNDSYIIAIYEKGRLRDFMHFKLRRGYDVGTCGNWVPLIPESCVAKWFKRLAEAEI